MSAFWVDAAADRRNASNSVSRYHAYAARIFTTPLDEDDLRPDSFAALSWQCATGPVMSSPPYVECDPRIVAAAPYPNDGVADLVMRVELVTELPTALRDALRGWRGWEWYGEEALPGMATPGRPVAMPSVALHVPIAADQLHRPGLDADVTDAARAVAKVVAALNDAVDPVLAALDAARAPATAVGRS